MILHTFVLLALYAFSQVPVTVSTDIVNDVAHIEFNGREKWDYALNSLDDGRVSIEVDQLDPKSLVTLKTFKNSLIKEIQVEEGVNNKNKIIFTPSSKEVRSFDYITDQPSRLILDFFKEEKSAANKKTESKKTASLPKKKKRNPASSEFLINPNQQNIDVANLDGADPNYNRFRIQDYEIKEAAIIAAQLNLYIHFPMMAVPISELQALNQEPPQYNFEKKEDEESKKAQLLLTLYNKKRNNVFLEALDLFKKEFPESKYLEELSFMEADTYYRKYLENNDVADYEKTTTLYSKVLLSIKNSKRHERTQRLLSYIYYERGDYLSAYQNFQRYLNQYPDSPYKYQTKMAIADSLAKLNNTKDAIEIFDEIENDKKSGIFGVEAAFRKADVFAQVKDYSKAIKEYDRVLEKYSTYQKDFPSAFYNKAESRFWLNRDPKNLRDSLNDYISFIQKFPKNDHASYAMTRIGELLEILGAPKKRYEGAFLESIYRYPNSQAAGVSKIRLLRERIPSMKESDIDDDIAKVDDFIKSSKLDKLKEFKTIMISDGYYSKENYDKALSILLTFYQENPLSSYLDIFKKRIIKTFRDQMLFSVQKGDYIKTFQVYGKNTATWFQDEDRLDIPYILGLAFEKTGVPDEAVKKYQHVLNKLYSIKGTQEEKERAVFENIPTTDELNLRLAAVHVFKNEYGKALEHLKEIDSRKLPNEDDRVENIYLGSIVNEKLNNVNTAIAALKNLSETWRGHPEKISKVLLRLALLQNGQSKKNEALVSLNRLINIAKDSGLVEDKVFIDALKTKAEIESDLNNQDSAIASYKDLLEKFESKYPLYSSRYELGKIYFDRKEIKEAEKVWSVLSENPSALTWSKLAQENLKNFNFKDEYKKYVDRIPAMANDKKEEKR